MDGGDEGEEIVLVKDHNGVPEEVLVEEEDIYHDPLTFKSIEALTYEIDTYAPMVMGPKYKGEDYRDLIDMKLMGLENQRGALMGGLQSGKLSPQKYLSVVYLIN